MAAIFFRKRSVAIKPPICLLGDRFTRKLYVFSMQTCLTKLMQSLAEVCDLDVKTETFHQSML